MKVLGIDQSLAKCAFVQLVDGKPVNTFLSKTGADTVKIKRKDTLYFKTLQEQIHNICQDLVHQVISFQPDMIVFESLSYGSVGNASRNLAELHGAMREVLFMHSMDDIIKEVAPTALKSYAHSFLPEDKKWDGLTAAKTPRKTKMDKKLVVEAVRQIYGEDYLKGYNYSSGLDDLADATFLAHKVWSQSVS